MAGGAGVPYPMPHGVDGPGNRTLGCLNDLRKRWNGVVLCAAKCHPRLPLARVGLLDVPPAPITV